MLVVYKAARVRDHLQENLRILSALPGDVVTTTYGPRWQSPAVTDEPPMPGEPALVVFTDPPYDRSTPVRLATVAEAVVNEHGYLTLTLELGEYAHAPSADAWQAGVAAVGNPGARPPVFVERADLGRLVEGAADPERAWRRIVERLARDPQYEKAIFARVASVRVAGEDEAGDIGSMPGLEVGVSHVVKLVHHNPHLEPAAQAQVRLLPMVDELAASAVMAESRGLDGPFSELLMEPMRPGRGELELHAIRGTEFLPVAWLTWEAVEAPVAEQPEIEPASALDTALESAPSAPADDALVQPSPVLAPISEATLARQDIAAPLVRAARLVSAALPDNPSLRLEILGELREAAADDPRIMEDIGIALYQADRAAEAAQTLATVPLDALGAEGRSVLLAATMVTGKLPEPIERLALADWTQPQTFERLLAASAHLSPADIQRLTEFLIDRLLSEDRAQTWLTAVIERTLPRQVLKTLVERWQYVDPEGAARALDRLLEAGRLHLAETDVARLAYDIAGPEMAGLRIQAARALVESAGRNDDRDALAELLADMRRPERHVHRSEFHELGDEIVRLIADITPEEAPIDGPLLAAADFIEDHRQAGELGPAARLAVFASANRSRASDETRARLDEVLEHLRAAQEASETYRHFLELQEAEANLDVRRAVAGLRLVLLGARRGDWWDALRTELALNDRTEWIESEKGRKPSMEPIEAAFKAGQVAALVVFTSHIAHATSTPAQKLAKKHEVPYITCRRPSREAFLSALRDAFVDTKAT